MDADRRLKLARDDIRAVGEALIRAAEVCDELSEADQLNAQVQAARQVLQSAAFTVGKLIENQQSE